MLEKGFFFCCCGITNLKLLFGMYGHIFRLFVCLSHAHTDLSCSFWQFHGYKTLLSMLK